MTIRYVIVFIVLVFSGLNTVVTAAELAAMKSKPRIVILATGGTIAGVQPDVTQARYDVAVSGVETLIAAVPQLETLADVSGEQVVSISSQNITNEIWLTLARRIDTLFAQREIDGIVITHGTDTMEETAFFLSLVLPRDKPIVLTGAMRPATALGADGPANLYNAVAVAAHPQSRGRGPLVVMNDRIFSAREVRKTNTTRPDAFVGTHHGEVGTVNTGTVNYVTKESFPLEQPIVFPLNEIAGEKLPRVEIIFAHAGCDGKPIDAAVENGASGIVVAGVGNGNTSESALESLKRATEKGIVVVRSSRVGGGLVERNMEIDDDALGFVAAMKHSPQKARILLMLALLQTRNVKQIQAYFSAM